LASYLSHALSPVRLWVHRLLSRQVLIITTVGRKTGQLRSTALGYAFDPATETYYVIAGWKGRTNWYRNALAAPTVWVRIGARKFEARATPLSPDMIATHLTAYAKRNPFAPGLYRRLTGLECDGTHERFLKMAPSYPGMALHQIV
jgi:deazaflavin-dependent oxidoreductase (nitroreductase family)